MDFRQRLCVTEQVRQEIERVVISHPFGSACLTNAGESRILEVKNLFDHDRGNRVCPAAGANQYRLCNRQRERDIEAE